MLSIPVGTVTTKIASDGAVRGAVVQLHRAATGQTQPSLAQQLAELVALRVRAVIVAELVVIQATLAAAALGLAVAVAVVAMAALAMVTTQAMAAPQVEAGGRAVIHILGIYRALAV